jgi:hypothetical protein
VYDFGTVLDNVRRTIGSRESKLDHRHVGMAATVAALPLIGSAEMHPAASVSAISKRGAPRLAPPIEWPPTMPSKPLGLAERAHKLAQSGEFEFVYQIERQLLTEGYPRVTVIFSDSAELRHALRERIKVSRENKAAKKRVGGGKR